MDELMINNKMITKDNGYELTSDRSSGGSNEGSSPTVDSNGGKEQIAVAREGHL